MEGKKSSVARFFAGTIISILIFQSISLSLADDIQLPAINTITARDEEKIKELLLKHRGDGTRPEACPLESKSYSDILAKIKNIQSLFKKNCEGLDQNRLDAILSGATQLDQQLQSISQNLGSGSGVTLPGQMSGSIGGVTISGADVANIVGNINQVFKDRSCQSLNKDQTFLQLLAGVIGDFAKIGLLIPNQTTLMVAGGGVATSSILLILDSILKKNFNFERTEDRERFIKLNCAFYDIRRNIEISGLLDVPTKAHENDQVIVSDLVKKLEEVLKSHQQQLEAREKVITEARQKYVQLTLGKVEGFSSLNGRLKSIVQFGPELSTHKYLVIQQISLIQKDVEKEFRTYLELGLNPIQLFDQLFLTLINRFDGQNPNGELDKLMALNLQEFKEVVVFPLQFHTERFGEDLKALEGKLVKRWNSETRINGLSLDDFTKASKDELGAKNKLVIEFLSSLKNVDTRLKRILGDVDFASNDDGSENIVNILAEFDSVANQIYGKYGMEFLTYTAEKSLKENKSFFKKYKRFAKRYLLDEQDKIRKPDPKDFDEYTIRFMCQDARPYRMMWRFSESLAQQGFDFLASNGDLFHSDIPRIFLGRSDGRIGIHGFKSKYEKIREHYLSAMYANKKMQGRSVPMESEKILKRKYIGRAMIQVAGSRNYAQDLQEVIERFQCNALAGLD